MAKFFSKFAENYIHTNSKNSMNPYDHSLALHNLLQKKTMKIRKILESRVKIHYTQRSKDKNYHMVLMAILSKN